MNEKCTHSLDFPHSSRGQRPRCQPKPTSRPGGALETIFGTCAPTPDGPFWLAASKPTREDGSNQIRLKIKAFRRNQTKIKPNLTLIKPKKWPPPALYQSFCIHQRPSTLRSIATEDGRSRATAEGGEDGSAVKNGKPKQGKARVFS
jgi:hypothetical protein